MNYLEKKIIYKRGTKQASSNKDYEFDGYCSLIVLNDGPSYLKILQ